MAIIWNQPRIKQLNKAVITALGKTADALLTEVVQAQVIPRGDTETLSSEKATYVDYTEEDKGVVEIVSDTKYARRLYYHPEYNYRQDKNENARGDWYEPWLTGSEKDKPAQFFAQFYKQEAGT